MEGMYGDGMNLYQYLGSNPWTHSDPLGLSSDPFEEIDAIIDEIMAERAGALSSIGKEAAATAIIAAQIASYLPFPGVGIAGDLALVALGQESMDNVLIGAAIGIIPGGKLVKLLKKSDVFQHLGRIGSAAWDYAKRMAGSGGGFLGRVAGGLADRARRLLDRKPKAIACGCFTASTLVWTANGAVPIVDIEQGQQVLAAPDEGAAEDYSSNEVGAKIVIGEASLVQLVVLHEDGSTETINTTDEHPFHVADTAQWTRADRLVVGDHLSTIASTAELQGVVYTTERVPVYNLSIPGSPTYYVGEHGVWVHNCDITSITGDMLGLSTGLTFKATARMMDEKFITKIGMIGSEQGQRMGMEIFGILPKLEDMAREQGAKVLRVEGVFGGDDRVMNVLRDRYGLMQDGAVDYIERSLR